MNEDKSVLGWRFKTTLRQQFDYSRYPFDREDVWIRLKSNDSTSVLVPDFDSYNSLIPETFPGMDRSFLLEGWEPQKTFFSYRLNSYSTNFGVGNFANSNVPELYFNVDVKRDFKGPFDSDLLPVMVEPWATAPPSFLLLSLHMPPSGLESLWAVSSTLSISTL